MSTLTEMLRSLVVVLLLANGLIWLWSHFTAPPRAAAGQAADAPGRVPEIRADALRIVDPAAVPQVAAPTSASAPGDAESESAPDRSVPF
ncbi:hypothetical protein [Comamonas sp. BIGb0124]|uniref:hypothetical protein n=1 Tax=Comamonas sp. BIGb0124 TaxID=2485130 RepID=UPI000F4A0941|nr:hypothetical protein [Comamonas sp. BIGb0124]